MKTTIIIVLASMLILLALVGGYVHFRDKAGLGTLPPAEVLTDSQKLDQVWDRFVSAFRFGDAQAVHRLLEPTLRKTTPVKTVEIVI